MKLTASATLIALGLFLAVKSSCGASLPQHEPTCGYKSCPKSEPNKVNIHLVAHTHDDVGWLKTVDQYYFGSRTNIQLAGVQYIIDSVIDALLKDPTRKFIYVETAFLWKWWQQQDEKQREIMRKLINEGRLEIIGGGWSMNDEAVTHYHSLVDQYTWGFRRLNDTFGACARPKIGWQIDPFGHSREQASMFAQMGFDGMLFARLDFQDRAQRLHNKSAEFVWEGSPSLGKSANIFTSILYNFYMAPSGFCFDIFCDDEPMIDDRTSPDYNIDRKLKAFLEFIDNQASHYRTNNVILTMGGDFMYHNAEIYFKNMDKLIRYVNQKNGTNYNAFYSTPSCYLKALNEKNLEWPIETQDFFPYGSDPNAYWTGYYTSRPALKFFERMGNNFLQVVKQLSVLTNEPDNKELQLFREAMGVLQHHDAITGTEKQHVAEDYARLLHYSFINGEKIASKAMKKLASKTANTKLEFNTCLLLNVSSCAYSSEHKQFVVTVYNPTSHPLTTYVRLPVRGAAYTVKDSTGQSLLTQVGSIPPQVRKIPGRKSTAARELVFEATNISPLGYQSFFVSRNESNLDPTANTKPDNRKYLYELSVNKQGKAVVNLLNENDEYDWSIEQYFHYYESAQGNNKEFKNRSSGAYVFRPKDSFGKSFSDNETQYYSTLTLGPIFQELEMEINDWISQVVRIYRGKSYVEFNWLVGPIDIQDNVGKEVITRYSTNLKTKGEFYTDSNGREMLKRTRNQRPNWKLELKEPVTGNYYPVTNKISIQDKNSSLRFSVLTDRAQGGSSLNDGEIELMVHRRILNDDFFGVSESLNETAFGEGLVVRGQHFLIGGNLTNLDELMLREKELAAELSLRPWLFITPVKSFDEWNANFKMSDQGPVKKLPRNVRILTLEPWKDGEVLLRLEHLFEKNESPKYSTPAEVDIIDLFSGFNVQAVQETTLGANQWTQDVNRLKWQPEINEFSETSNTNSGSLLKTADSIIVRLNPMEIRTFIVKVSLE